MKKVIIDDYCSGDKHAGAKARGDISRILDSWENIYLFEKEKSLFTEVITIFRRDLMIHFTKGKGYITLTQFPLYLEGPFFLRKIPMLNKAAKNIVLIHDLNSVRFSHSSKREIRNLNKYDVIISHNSCMSQYLRKMGVKKPMVDLEIFDYLCMEYYEKIDCDKYQKDKPVVIAGNLDKSKSGYVYSLPENVEFRLYGINYGDTDGQGNVHYQGAYQPEELAALLEGSFGLVWDGNSTETCIPYLSINNSHKTSLYLAAGLPVILWKQDAHAKFVEEHQCGILVDTLEEISQKISSMTEEEYQVLKRNAGDLSKRITCGYYTKKAVNKALKELFRNNF